MYTQNTFWVFSISSNRWMETTASSSNNLKRQNQLVHVPHVSIIMDTISCYLASVSLWLRERLGKEALLREPIYTTPDLSRPEDVVLFNLEGAPLMQFSTTTCGSEKLPNQAIAHPKMDNSSEGAGLTAGSRSATLCKTSSGFSMLLRQQLFLTGTCHRVLSKVLIDCASFALPVVILHTIS